MRRFVAILAVVASAGLIGVVVWVTAPGKPPNVVIILIDTLRPDYLSLYGAQYPTSPFIDSLGQNGTVFTRATAQSSYTPPSVASFLTSLYPSCHGVARFGRVLPDHIATLAEVFQDKGYRTGCFSAHWALKQDNGFGQGFEHFEVIDEGTRKGSAATEGEFLPAFARAEKVNEAVVRWLDQPDSRPTFLYVHYMDVHSDYNPPAPYREMFAGSDPILTTPRKESARFMFLVMRSNSNLPVEDDAVEHLRNLYRGEIAYVDSQIQQLMAELKQRKMYRDSWIVLWSDHGEEFYEHKGFSHGETLYNEVISVPLIIVEPGWLKHGRVSDAPVQLIDVAPTLCDLLGFDTPTAFQGSSLASLFRNQRYVGAEWFHSEVQHHRAPWRLRSLSTGDYKVICRNPTPEAPVDTIELYDVAADPGELSNLSESPDSQGVLADMLDVLESIGCPSPGKVETPPTVDEELRNRLRAVGYL